MRAVIFDFDYTLADPSPGVAACVNFALAGLGLPAASPEAISLAMRGSLPDTFRQLAGPAQADQYQNFFELFVQHAHEVMAESTTLYQTVPAMVEHLLEHKLNLGIVSMKYRPHIEPVLQRAGLLAAFRVIVGGDEVKQLKPHPEGLQRAMHVLQSTPAETVYAGDSVSDAEAAARAGVPFVAVLSGHLTRADFQNYPVCQFIEDIAALPGWLEDGYGLNRLSRPKSPYV